MSPVLVRFKSVVGSTVVLYRHSLLVLIHSGRRSFLIIFEGHWRIFFKFCIRPLFLRDFGTIREVWLLLECLLKSVLRRIDRVNWLHVWVDLILTVRHHLVWALLLGLLVREGFKLFDWLRLDLRNIDLRAWGLLSLPLLFHDNSHGRWFCICLRVLSDSFGPWKFVVLQMMWWRFKDLIHVLVWVRVRLNRRDWLVIHDGVRLERVVLCWRLIMHNRHRISIAKFNLSGRLNEFLLIDRRCGMEHLLLGLGRLLFFPDDYFRKVLRVRGLLLFLGHQVTVRVQFPVHFLGKLVLILIVFGGSLTDSLRFDLLFLDGWLRPWEGFLARLVNQHLVP